MDNLSRGSILKDKIAGIASNALHTADKKISDFIKQTPTDQRPMRYRVVHKGGALVRAAEDVESEFVHQLKSGDVVTISEIVGRRCRIIAPVNGWVSLRTKTDDIQILKPVPFGSLVNAQQSSGSFENHFEQRFQELKGKQGTRATVTDDKLTRWVDDDRPRSFDSQASDNSSKERAAFSRRARREGASHKRRDESRSDDSSSSARRRDEQRRKDGLHLPPETHRKEANNTKSTNASSEGERQSSSKPALAVETNLLWGDDDFVDAGFVSAPARATPSGVSSSIPVLEPPRGSSSSQQQTSQLPLIPCLPAPGTSSSARGSSITVIPAPSPVNTTSAVPSDIPGGAKDSYRGTLLNLDEPPTMSSNLLDFDPFGSSEKKKSVSSSNADPWSADFSQFPNNVAPPATSSSYPHPQAAGSHNTTPSFASFLPPPPPPPPTSMVGVNNAMNGVIPSINAMNNTMGGANVAPQHLGAPSGGATMQMNYPPQPQMGGMMNPHAQYTNTTSAQQHHQSGMNMQGMNMQSLPGMHQQQLHQQTSMGSPQSIGMNMMSMQQQSSNFIPQSPNRGSGASGGSSSIYALSQGQGATPTPMGMAALYGNTMPMPMSMPAGGNMPASPGMVPNGLFGQQ